MAEDKVSIVRVKLLNMPDYIFSSDQWKNEGGYKGFVKNNGVSIRDITGIEYGATMSAQEFNDLPAWEG